MSKSRFPDPAALRTARHLRALDPAQALGRAEAAVNRAIGDGDIARADLYMAVCVVLADRQSVFSNMVVAA